ncbi:MAG: WbqC family protein [Bacteroidota bacterium]
MSKALLNTAYFPPVQYMSVCAGYEEVYIEANENYEKQSYRNRCTILGPNGTQNLSIPVIKGRSPGQPIRDVKIDYSTPWQGNHRRSIETAYAAAPYFEHYYDEIKPFFKKKSRFLFDHNLMICNLLLVILEINTEIKLTNTYLPIPPQDTRDYRNLIHPKKTDITYTDNYSFQPYMQVFNERFSFQPGLSILDLLFNEGPVSKQYLIDFKI